MFESSQSQRGAFKRSSTEKPARASATFSQENLAVDANALNDGWEEF